MICPAKDKRSGKCFGHSYFQFKPGKVQECGKVCNYLPELTKWFDSRKRKYR